MVEIINWHNSWAIETHRHKQKQKILGDVFLHFVLFGTLYKWEIVYMVQYKNRLKMVISFDKYTLS